MNDLQSLLRKHEEERLKPYRCTAGKLTIGVGRNLDDVGISPDESAYLLANDMKRVEQEIARTWPWARNLDPVRYAVLADMTFNLGLSRLLGFKKFLAHMAASNWTVAAAEMQDSAWYRQVGTRAVRLQKMILTGSWPRA